jgi:RNA polymerase primary sigma factor
MHARSISVHLPFTPAEKGKRAFRGARVEAEAILKGTKKQGHDGINGAGYLRSLTEQTKVRGRFLSKDEEYAIFTRYNKARDEIKSLKKELKGLKNGAARTPKARRIERGIHSNKNVMRSAETIIIAAHDGLIHSRAKWCMRVHTPRHLTEADLVQEAKYALVRNAIPKFDPDKGYYFSTYGNWWIVQAMERVIATDEMEVRLPVHRHEAAQRLNRFRRVFLTKKGREPTEEEIYDEMGTGSAKLATPRMISIYRKERDKDGEAWDLLSTLPDVNAEDSEKTAIRNEDKGRAKGLLNALTPKERMVIRMRFGLDGEREHTLEEVGQSLGVTRERIRQIEQKALGKIRRAQEHRERAGFDGPTGGNGRAEPLNNTINK